MKGLFFGSSFQQSPGDFGQTDLRFKKGVSRDTFWAEEPCLDMSFF